MAHKILLLIILGLALILGIFSVTLNHDLLTIVVLVSRFFEVMIPVLGVGALLKYLCCHGKAKACCKSACAGSSCETSGSEQSDACCKEEKTACCK